MKLIPLQHITLFLLLGVFSSSLHAENIENIISGTYRSNVHESSVITLHLYPDHSARLECAFWYAGASIDRRINTYPATWIVDGIDLVVTYNGIVQRLTYHHALSLAKYGLPNHQIPGLTPSENNCDDGLLDSVPLWRHDDLQHLLNQPGVVIRTQPNTRRLNVMTMILIVCVISAIVGCKRPLLGGMTGALILPLLYGFFSSLDVIPLITCGVLGLLIGFTVGIVSSLLLSGMKGKGHNVGPSVIGGFGGGRGGFHQGRIILSDEERQRRKR